MIKSHDFLLATTTAYLFARSLKCTKKYEIEQQFILTVVDPFNIFASVAAW